jgi:hypothetical protein
MCSNAGAFPAIRDENSSSELAKLHLVDGASTDSSPDLPHHSHPDVRWGLFCVSVLRFSPDYRAFASR